MLMISGVAINGFFAITRGEWITRPTGEKIWVGKVFSFWSKFLQRHELVPYIYAGNELYKILAQHVSSFFNEGEIFDIKEASILIGPISDIRKKLLIGILSKHDIEVKFETSNIWEEVTFIKKVKKFNIPFWITAPLGECITCLSSFWGTVCWLFWYQVVLSMQTTSYEAAMFMELPSGVKILMWIFFCISLAYVNEILFFINNKLKQ